MEKTLRRRGAAFGIDVALLAIAAALLSFAAGFLESPAWLAELALIALPFAYFATLESGNRCASLGKRLLSLRVTRSDGKPLDGRRAVARYAILGAPGTFAGLACLLGDRLFSYLPPDHA